AVPMVDGGAPSFTALGERADAAQVTETGHAAVDHADAAAAEARTASDAAAARDEPQSTVEVPSTDASQARPPETPMRVATADPSDPLPGDTRTSAGSIEIVDECLVADICIDRYLWAIYQRTPKQDSIRVHERRNVTVKKKRKMVTVSRIFTRLVDE